MAENVHTICGFAFECFALPSSKRIRAGPAEEDDPYRSGFLDGLRSARNGEKHIVTQKQLLTEAIDSAKHVRLADVQKLFERWACQDDDILEAFGRLISLVRVRLADLIEAIG